MKTLKCHLAYTERLRSKPSFGKLGSSVRLHRMICTLHLYYLARTSASIYCCSDIPKKRMRCVRHCRHTFQVARRTCRLLYSLIYFLRWCGCYPVKSIGKLGHVRSTTRNAYKILKHSTNQTNKSGPDVSHHHVSPVPFHAGGRRRVFHVSTTSAAIHTSLTFGASLHHVNDRGNSSPPLTASYGSNSHLADSLVFVRALLAKTRKCGEPKSHTMCH